MRVLPHLTSDKLIAAFYTLLSAAIIQVVFTTPLNYTYLSILLSVGAVLGIWYLRDSYSRPIRFVLKVKEHWELDLAKSRPRVTPPLDSTLITDSDRTQSSVVTEFVAESTSASVLWFFPATDVEKNEVFGRIARVYIARLSNRSEDAMGLQRRIPLRVDAHQVTSPVEGIKEQIVYRLQEPADSQAVQSVFALIKKNKYSVLLLVDAMNKTAYDLKKWLDWPKYEWIPKTIIAAHPETEAEVRSESGQSFAFLQLAWTGGDGASPPRLEAELAARIGTLRARGKPSASEYRAGMRALGFAFLRLKLQRPDQAFYSDGEIRPHYQDVLDLIDQLPSWIDSRSTGAIKYAAWRREFQAMRDMLAASLIIDSEALEENFCKTVNDSPICCYVRPMLDYIAEDRNKSEHVLSKYQLTPAHRFIKNAWQARPVADEEIVRLAREVMRQMPDLFIDPRDIASLLPGFVRAGVSAEFAPLFKQVRSSVRVSSILDSEASGKELADALENLVEDAELWAYFESGGRSATNIAAQLLTLPNQKLIIRCLMIMILAPHGPIITSDMVSHLEHAAKWEPGLWEYSTLPAMSSEDLDLVAYRINDIAQQMSDLGRNWIGRMNGISLVSSNLTGLQERLVEI